MSPAEWTAAIAAEDPAALADARWIVGLGGEGTTFMFCLPEWPVPSAMVKSYVEAMARQHPGIELIWVSRRRVSGEEIRAVVTGGGTLTEALGEHLEDVCPVYR